MVKERSIRVALGTGGGQGIGREVVRRLQDYDMKVIVAAGTYLL